VVKLNLFRSNWFDNRRASECCNWSISNCSRQFQSWSDQIVNSDSGELEWKHLDLKSVPGSLNESSPVKGGRDWVQVAGKMQFSSFKSV